MLRIRDVVLLIVILAAFLFLYSSWFTVKAGEVAFLGNWQSGNVKTPGLHVKWPWQKLTTFQTLPQVSNVVLTDLVTEDNVHFNMTIAVVWQLADLKKYLDKDSPDVSSTIESAFRQHLTALFATQQMSHVLSDEVPLEAMITDNLTALLSAAGVNVQAVKISDVSFNGKSLETAYAGMRSNAASMAEKVASDNQKQALALKEQADDELMQPLSDAYTQAAEIIADGQSEAASIIAPAYHKNPAFFNFFMSTKAGE